MASSDDQEQQTLAIAADALGSTVPDLLINGVWHHQKPGHARFTRWLHELLPHETQFGWRDNGAIRMLFDGGAVASAGILAVTNPGVAMRFLAVGRRLKTYSYADHPSQIVEVVPAVQPQEAQGTAAAATATAAAAGAAPGRPRILVFVHGGAWGSGKPWMYRLLADRLSKVGYTVALIGYRSYPDGDVDDQIHDVGAAMEWLGSARGAAALRWDTSSSSSGSSRSSSSGGSSSSSGGGGSGGRSATWILTGHSSGAHVAAMYLLRRCTDSLRFARHPPVHGLVGFSGVFDIHKHYLYEAWRGVHLVSPMRAANGGDVERFLHYSPSDIAGRRLSAAAAARFPPTLLLHGTGDATVPFTSTEEFRLRLQSRGVPVVARYFLDDDHFSTVGNIMFQEGSQAELVVGELCAQVEQDDAPTTAAPPGSLASRL